MNTQQLWQAQALDAPRVSLAFVRQQSDALLHRTRTQSAFKYILAATSVALMARKVVPLISIKPLIVLSMAMWVAGCLIIVYLRRKRFALQEQPAEFGVLDALKFHRRQLERQRDARRGSWRWWMPPIIPGAVMLFVALFVDFTPTPWTKIIFCAIWFVFACSLSIVMTGRSARRIQKEIDALDSL